ncbi:hypothetical protein [Tolypothrix sp. VBCCA 56010]|uniref:hypothetical protein n=1 Tax=Tolypothrix sp. VBCCA 56010 TaxID=3137731 RepID=UPI003D7E65EA
MTNPDQPQDASRLDRLEQRVSETWERATINTETIAGMQESLQQLLTIALAQQQTTANLAQSTASLERSVGQILQYLRDRNGGSSI